jgi:putative phosphoribosyl transferase
MRFRDRRDAGGRLAAALAHYSVERPVVLALPRGGVPVAAMIATALAAPLDLILVRKIGVPFHKELAMGAVVDGGRPTIVRNQDVIAMAGITEEAFQSVCDAELGEIERRRRAYVGARAPVTVAGRTVVVVDDGLATGATMKAALRALKMRAPRRLVMAVPVAPPDTLAEMQPEADDIVCLEAPAAFDAIGAFYEDFRQVSDRQVIALLAACGAAPRGTPHTPPQAASED